MANNNPKTLGHKLSRAFEFSVSEPVEMEKNGRKWHEFPVTLKARDGGPILHGWWGKIAHDFKGMSVPAAKRIPIDHVHSDKALGYINEFDTSDGHLILKGKYVSTEKGDLAWTIATQIIAGVPFQSSIFFDDPEDGEMEIDEVKKEKSVTVNGFTWTGPGLIVKKWLLRGVATCLYGADSKTSTQVLKHQSITTHEETMTPQEQLKRFTELFGAELANKYFSEGLDESEATAKFNAVLKERNEATAKQLAEKDAKIAELEKQLAATDDQAKQLAEKETKIAALEKQLGEATAKLEVWNTQYGGRKYADGATGQGMSGPTEHAGYDPIAAEKAFAAELHAASAIDPGDGDEAE